MQNWLFYFNGYTRNTLSTIINKFVEENEFLFTYRQRLSVRSMTPCPAHQNMSITMHSKCSKNEEKIAVFNMYRPTLIVEIPTINFRFS